MMCQTITNIVGKKKHKENRTGTSESFKPTKIKKDIIKKYETWK